MLLCAGSSDGAAAETDDAAAETDENLDSYNRPADVQLQSPFKQAEPKAQWPISADAVVKTEPMLMQTNSSDIDKTKKPKRKRGQTAAA